MSLPLPPAAQLRKTHIIAIFTDDQGNAGKEL